MSHSGSIAIDGPVASGKTLVGSLLAKRLGCRFLDTGAMYRAVTWAALERESDLEDEVALTRMASSLDIRLVSGEAETRLLVDGWDITDQLRDAEVERWVSAVSSVSGVRAVMVEQQRAIARKGLIVMVGRDIGTVVLPDATTKVFLNASVEVRARRRYHELQEQGHTPDYEQVLSELIRRDRIDTERDDSPLRPAADAIQIETDALSPEEVIERIVAVVECG